MNRLSWAAFASSLGMVVAGCATQTEVEGAAPGCADAAARIEQCLGLDVGVDGCDEATASAALTMSCEELARAEGKSDCGFFTPWDCWNFSTGGSSSGTDSGGYAISVSVDECMSSYIDLCAGVSSLACAHVVLSSSSGEVVAEGYTNVHGGLLFSDLEADVEYTVRVERRDGEVAEAIFGDYTQQAGPAVQSATAEHDGPARVRFSLRSGEEEIVRSCARVVVPVDVVEPDGTPVDAAEIEWDWIATYEDLSGPTMKRIYRFYGAAVSSLDISSLRPGAHEILFHRISVPDRAECNWYYIGGDLRFGGQSLWYGDECRLPNRNELLLENFAVDDVDPIAVQITVTEADLGDQVTTEPVVLTDPVPGE